MLVVGRCIKTNRYVIESKVVFHTGHGRRPAVTTKSIFQWCPNVVRKLIVQDLRRAVGFIAATPANAIVWLVLIWRRSAKRRGRRNFDHFLSFAVGEDNPVWRVGEDDARLFAWILQTFLKVLWNDSWNPKLNLDNCKPKCGTWNVVLKEFDRFQYCKSLMFKNTFDIFAMTHVTAIDAGNVQNVDWGGRHLL